MATTIYQAVAGVVKVSVGPADGNRVARIIRSGSIIPEGVERDQLAALEKRGIIRKVEAPADPDAEAADAAKAEAAAKAKADAEAKAKAEAEAAGKKPASK